MAFLLIALIGIVLIAVNLRAMKKEKTSFTGILDEKVDHMEEFEVRIGELRVEFAETILEIQKEMEEFNGRISLIEKIDEKKQNKTVEKVEEYDKIEDNKSRKRTTRSKINKDTDNNRNNVKVNEIEALIKQGMEIDEIAEKLHIGKGEVLLIKELYLK